MAYYSLEHYEHNDASFSGTVEVYIDDERHTRLECERDIKSYG